MVAGELAQTSAAGTAAIGIDEAALCSVADPTRPQASAGRFDLERVFIRRRWGGHIFRLAQ